MDETTTRSAGLVAVATALLIGAATVDGQEGIFRAVEQSEPGRLAANSASPREGRDMSRQWREVEFDVSTLLEQASAGFLVLNLFNDTVFHAVIQDMEWTGRGYVLSGTVSEIEMGAVTLAVTANRVTGTVRTPRGTYRIRPHRDSRRHDIILVNPVQPPLGEPLPTCGVGAERRVCDEEPR